MCTLVQPSRVYPSWLSLLSHNLHCVKRWMNPPDKLCNWDWDGATLTNNTYPEVSVRCTNFFRGNYNPAFTCSLVWETLDPHNWGRKFDLDVKWLCVDRGWKLLGERIQLVLWDNRHCYIFHLGKYLGRVILELYCLVSKAILSSNNVSIIICVS